MALPLARPEGWGCGAGREGHTAKASNHPFLVGSGYHVPGRGSAVETPPRLLSAYYVPGPTQWQVLCLLLLFTASPPPQLQVDVVTGPIFTGAGPSAPRITAGPGTANGGWPIRTQALARRSQRVLHRTRPPLSSAPRRPGARREADGSGALVVVHTC